jgi:hypothetical protein
MQPIEKTPVTPALPNAPNAILDLAESTFNGIGIEWNPGFILKPPVEEGTNTGREMFDVYPGFSILLLSIVTLNSFLP